MDLKVALWVDSTVLYPVPGIVQANCSKAAKEDQLLSLCHW